MQQGGKIRAGSAFRLGPCLLVLVNMAPVRCPAQAVPGGAPAVHRELAQGEALMRQAFFAEAIPHLRQAIADGARGYAVHFNLALCFVGTAQYSAAGAELQRLRAAGEDSAGVEDLLAQAWLGVGDTGKAWAAAEAAARLAPRDERMYALLTDACQDHGDTTLGLRVAALGLRILPASARLHYARALFLAQLDRLGEATPEFAAAARLGAGTSLGTLAEVQLRLYQDRYAEAAATARAAIAAGDSDATMLTLLANVLLAGGAAPGQPAFAEARALLQQALRKEPGYATAEIAMGTLALREGNAAEALPHLQAGRRMEPENRAVYMQLAAAYRQTGHAEQAKLCLEKLGALVQAGEAAKAEGR